MSDLVIRAYNVLFGDAILVSIPDRGADGVEQTRHILIDVGNLLANDRTVFTPVVADIAARTGGEVDLYVMTHEHLDHVHGLLAAKKAGVDLAANTAWLTASAAKDYYETHTEARRQRLDDERLMLDLVVQHSAASDPWMTTMIQNNNALLPPAAFGLTTAEYVDHLRSVAPQERTHYVHRETDVAGKHPFHEAQLRILAPEENTADYYGRRKKNFTLTATGADAGTGSPPTSGPGAPAPPVGVDAGAFYDLVASRNHLNRQSLLEIDSAANNTSIVFEITWRGWKLLFPGDAEERSWNTMLQNKLLEPVHFVKIAHHGSVNGTVATVLDTVLPAVNTDGRPRRALVSTHAGDWQSVPDKNTLELYRHRQDCTLFDTREVEDGEAVEIRFPGDG